MVLARPRAGGEHETATVEQVVALIDRCVAARAIRLRFHIGHKPPAVPPPGVLFGLMPRSARLGSLDGSMSRGGRLRPRLPESRRRFTLPRMADIPSGAVTLALDCREESLASARESDEERVSLGVYFVAVMGVECRAKEPLMLLEHLAVTFS